MSLLLDHFWIWVVLTFVVGGCSFSWYTGDQKKYKLVIAVLLPVLTLALGLFLYFGITTDRKTIQRTLDSLITAIEQDDFGTARKFFSPKANEIVHDARDRMNFARISRAKYRDLKIEINDAPSPPIATVQFSAIFYWQNKKPIDGFTLDQPIPENARFRLELVKTKNQSWLLTDNYRCSISSVP